LTFNFSIPVDQGNKEVALNSGESLIFVGANGGGKTRLAVYIENIFELNAHRISAH